MLVGNEIELGIVIPTIRSRTSKVSRDKVMGYDVYGSSDHTRGMCRSHYGYPDPADDY